MDFLHLFRAGGFMMYPLILCSLVVVAILLNGSGIIDPIVPMWTSLAGIFRNIWKTGL